MQALFEINSIDRRIYTEELRDFLPNRMVDIHTHVWLERLKSGK